MVGCCSGQTGHVALAQRDEQPAKPGVARVSEAGWMGQGRRNAFVSVREHAKSV